MTHVARLISEDFSSTRSQRTGHGRERRIRHAQRAGGFLRLERFRYERSNPVPLGVALAGHCGIAAILFAGADAQRHQRDHQCRTCADASWPSLGAPIKERQRGEEHRDDRRDDKDTDYRAGSGPVLSH
jgi:hypothetical protein